MFSNLLFVMSQILRTMMIKTSSIKQKSNVDKWRRPLSFFMDDHDFFRVTSFLGFRRTIISKKMTPKIIGSY